MAIGWFAALQAIPWSDVIKHAPAVVERARKLWNNIAGKPPQPAGPVSRRATAPSTAPPDLLTIAARLVAAESSVAELHAQMLRSSELIKELAEQNAQLIKRIEINEVRVRRLSIATAAVAVLALVVLAIALGGRPP